jgi:nucleotide-binding universal stress UspA family protein
MTVVVGYIPTPEGSAAMDHAIAWARGRQARLVVVNTGHAGNYNHPNFATPQDIDALEAELSGVGLDHEVRRPTGGRSAAEELLRAAGDANAELIVIGIRHRSPVGKLITGSTAQQVLLEAECPVLAVKAART